MILANKYGKTPYLSDSPSRKELERMSIPQLLVIATYKRHMKNPFKPVLVSYILSLGKI